MSTTGTGLVGALSGTRLALENEGGELVTPMIVGASWTRSSLISKVTTRALDIEVQTDSWVMATSGVGWTIKVSSSEAAAEPSSAPVLTIEVVV